MKYSNHLMTYSALRLNAHYWDQTSTCL